MTTQSAIRWHDNIAEPEHGDDLPIYVLRDGPDLCNLPVKPMPETRPDGPQRG